MYIAKLRNAPFSSYKGRLVIENIRGLNVDEALNILKFSKKKAAHNIKKLLESAIANAEYKDSVDIDELFVKEAFVDDSFMLKRIRARAKGRANRISKRTCNITIKLSNSGI